MKDQVVRPDEATPVNLTSGDIIQYGDEWKYADETQWKRVRWHLGETVANFRSKEERSVELRRPTSLIAKSNLGEVDPGEGSAYRRHICEKAAEDIFPPKPWDDPGEGWRMLEGDEIVQKGDSVYDSRIGQWSEMHAPLSPTVVVLLGYSWIKAVRRRIEPEVKGLDAIRAIPGVEELWRKLEAKRLLPQPDLSRILDAINGDNPDQKRIAKVGLEWLALILRKNADYGCSVWEVPVLAPATDAKTAILVRMSDKVSRIRNLLSAEQQVSGESLEDTLRDLGAYCLLYLAAPKPVE